MSNIVADYIKENAIEHGSEAEAALVSDLLGGNPSEVDLLF